MFRRYTLYVNFMRGFLPLIAVIGLAIVIAWPLVNEWKTKELNKYHVDTVTAADLSMTMPAAGQPAQLQVTKPEFTGRDNQGRPYVITATRVLQDVQIANPQQGIMHLESPSAKMTLNKDTGEAITLQAEKGVYDPKSQTLTLNDRVVLVHSDGYTMNMSDLYVDLIKGLSSTQQPVSGVGPLGSIEGQSMELRDKGNEIILHGKSKVVLTPQADPKKT